MTRGVFQPFSRRKKPAKKAPSSADSSVKGHGPQASCSTCYNLDFQYIPQPHKDRRICSIGQIARHWIPSDKFTKNTGCESCQLLKSAFDTLTSSWGISSVEGSAIPYQIAIIDQDDEDAGDTDEQESGRANRQVQQSLKVIMRCDPEYTKGGKKGGFDEEFEIEIYTPMTGEKSNFLWPLYIENMLYSQARHRIGRLSVPLAKYQRIRAPKNARILPDTGSRSVI